MKTYLMTLILCFVATPAMAQINLVGNGGFEDLVYPHPLTSLNTLAPNERVELIQPWFLPPNGNLTLIKDSNTEITGPAAEGHQYLSIQGPYHGGISQMLTTTPGKAYTFGFSYSHDLRYDQSEAFVITHVNSPTMGNLVHEYFFDTTIVTDGDLNWSTFTAEFTAVDEQTSIGFGSMIGRSSILIDDVYVYPVVPESGTTTLLLVAGVTMLSLRRRPSRNRVVE